MRTLLVLMLLAGSAFAEEEAKPLKPPPPPEELVREVEPPAVTVRVQSGEAPKAKAEAGSTPRLDTPEESQLRQDVDGMMRDGEEQRLRILSMWEETLKDSERRGDKANIERSNQEIAAIKKAKGSFVPSIKLEPVSFGEFKTPVEITQVVDADNCIAKLGEATFWIEGMPTAGIVDGGSYRLGHVFSYAGTKQYRTVLGATRTIHRVRRMPIETLERR